MPLAFMNLLNMIIKLLLGSVSLVAPLKRTVQLQYGFATILLMYILAFHTSKCFSGTFYTSGRTAVYTLLPNHALLGDLL